MVYKFILFFVLMMILFFYKELSELLFSPRQPPKEETPLRENYIVYLDIEKKNQYKSEYMGRIVIELFRDTVPKTSYNFYQLCQSKQYQNVPFHRIIHGFMIQSGDITQKDGTGGKSIFEGNEFEDENFILKHDTEGLLSMANRGPNTNTSQFFILTTKDASHLDGKHVVFGRVMEGYSVVKMIEMESKDLQDRPLQDIVISDCGVITEK